MERIMYKAMIEFDKLDKTVHTLIVIIALVIVGVAGFKIQSNCEAIDIVKESKCIYCPNTIMETIFDNYFQEKQYKAYDRQGIKNIDVEGRGLDLKGQWRRIRLTYEVGIRSKRCELTKVAVDEMPIHGQEKTDYIYNIYNTTVKENE